MGFGWECLINGTMTFDKIGTRLGKEAHTSCPCVSSKLLNRFFVHDHVVNKKSIKFLFGVIWRAFTKFMGRMINP